MEKKGINNKLVILVCLISMDLNKAKKGNLIGNFIKSY